MTEPVQILLALLRRALKFGLSGSLEGVHPRQRGSRTRTEGGKAYRVNATPHTPNDGSQRPVGIVTATNTEEGHMKR